MRAVRIVAGILSFGLGCYLANEALSFFARVVRPTLNPPPNTIVHVSARFLGLRLRGIQVNLAPWIAGGIAIGLVWAGIYLIARQRHRPQKA